MGSRPNLPEDIASRLSNLPNRGAPVGTVYAPLLTKSLDNFPYFRQESGFNLIGTVDRAHVDSLADAVSKEVGEGYCVPPLQALLDKVYRDPETITDPLMKEIAKYTWAHAREARAGRKVFSYPKVRCVDDGFRITGKSTEVEINEEDAVAALEQAVLLKLPKGAKIFRGRFWADPASFRARWDSDEGAFGAVADAPFGRNDAGVALLMRTDEVQERNVVEIDADDLDALQRKASDGKTWKSRYEAARRDFRALSEKHF